MTVGTKSVLGGAHCFLVHPLLVAYGWWRLFGFPYDPRLWCAFALHDAGYLGRAEMDSASGEEHVVLGARIMGWLFGPAWADECLRHSRYWSRRMGMPVSRLCLADKLAFALAPAWLYLPMARWTGELQEYMERSRERQAGDGDFTDEEARLVRSAKPEEWLRGLQSYTRRWVERHRKRLGALTARVSFSAFNAMRHRLVPLFYFQVNKETTDMLGYSKIQIMGNLGGAPEQRVLPSGESVVNFSVAVNRKYKDREGVQKTATDWYRVCAFNGLGAACAQHLDVGAAVFVEGRLQVRQFETKHGGAQISVDIIPTTMRFLGGSGGGLRNPVPGPVVDESEETPF